MHPAYASATDAALIAAFLKGENAAFEALFLRHKDRVYTSIFFLVKEQVLAEDLFQDCFLKVLRTMREGRYNEQGKFLPWVLCMAHNICIDHFRKLKTQSTMLCGEESVLEVLSPQSVPEARLETEQTNTILYGLINRLATEQYEVLVMRLYGDLSFKEIAEATGVSVNTALGRMRYALINLRRMVDEKELVEIL